MTTKKTTKKKKSEPNSKVIRVSERVIAYLAKKGAFGESYGAILERELGLK